ncbi:MAG: YlbF family regulator [Lachnospiraceae bacterium]|nr:YlbF family regulator [Lachnospiraceae bacterium]
MKEVINQSKELNKRILDSTEYKYYLETKKSLKDSPELSHQLKEFRRRNYELQNRQGVNPYDELCNLVREYDDLLHNSTVSNFLRAEQHICRMMQEVYNSIAEGLELDYLDE